LKEETKEERLKRELKDDDLSTVATLMFHGLEDIKLIKKFWPRYIPSRYEKNKKKVYIMVNSKMNKYLKKFVEFFGMLTDVQADAIKAEWFYHEAEKPNQEQSVKNLNITVSSYQERLELAYKKLEKLYPNLKRVRRRKPQGTSKTMSKYPEKRLFLRGKSKNKTIGQRKMDFYLQSIKQYSQDYILAETDPQDNDKT
jgi:uncharacterized coiled-coil protein SlyX